MFTNKTTRPVKVGNITVGGGAPISIQSMLNAPAHDIGANVNQALELEKAGCEIVRISVPRSSTGNIPSRSKIPLSLQAFRRCIPLIWA